MEARQKRPDPLGEGDTVNESEDRLHVNRPLFKQPGTSQPRRHEGNPKAREGWRGMEGPSPRAERKAADKAAAAKQKPRSTPAEQLAKYREMVASGELARQAAASRARPTGKRVVDEHRPSGVWQLQSWMEGGKPCPEERLEWR